MQCCSVDDSCIFYKSPVYSKNNGLKRNPEELIWKRGKYYFLIFIIYNPPWLVISATLSSSSTSSSSVSLYPSETWWGWGTSFLTSLFLPLAMYTNHPLLCHCSLFIGQGQTVKSREPNPQACKPLFPVYHISLCPWAFRCQVQALN